MSSFARTPGNTRHDVLSKVLNNPRQRVQRILQVTRSYWWPADRAEDKPVQQRFGPGHRPLKVSHQG